MIHVNTYVKFKTFTTSITYDNIVRIFTSLDFLQLTTDNHFCNIKQENTILFVFGHLIKERK